MEATYDPMDEAAEDEADCEGMESSKPAALSRSRRASTSDEGKTSRQRSERRRRLEQMPRKETEEKDVRPLSN